MTQTTEQNGLVVTSMTANVNNSNETDRVFDIEGNVEINGGEARVAFGTVRKADSGENYATFSEYDNGHLNITYEAKEGREGILAEVEAFVQKAKTAFSTLG